MYSLPGKIISDGPEIFSSPMTPSERIGVYLPSVTKAYCILDIKKDHFIIFHQIIPDNYLLKNQSASDVSSFMNDEIYDSRYSATNPLEYDFWADWTHDTFEKRRKLVEQLRK
jgi:hypothetical protein